MPDNFAPSRKAEAIIIPAFIQQGLIRNQLSYDDFLNLDKVKPFFSLNDLALLLLLNEDNASVFDFENENHLNNFWSNSSSFEQINNLKQLQQSDLKQRLSDDSLFTSTSKPYEIKDNHSAVVFVVLYPAFFSTQELYSSNSKALVKDLLKLLYGYNNYDIVTRHTLFKKYLSSL
jgi:hypothetical protein